MRLFSCFPHYAKWNRSLLWRPGGFFPACLALLGMMLIPPAWGEEASHKKTASVLYPRSLSLQIISNAQKFPWAKEAQARVVERARPWREASDDALWSMMFGATLPRSWMVWSDGYCPACKKDVKMYDWIMDPWNHPYKTQCPHCQALFPTNDFAAFYQSGLDEHGVFDPERADRSLLFNTEHPDSNDPLHLFGVDDGTGFVEGDKRWRFIGAYLVYGQWKKLVLAGIVHLGEAFFVTGDPVYARKAAILLDRVADVYPTFDFKEQAVVYERKLGSNGYISTWHDACEEVRELAQAYDQIFDALPNDSELVAFLSGKAKQYAIENPKTTFADIQANIENRIFRDTIEHEYKIRSNYPRTPVSILTMETVLDWPANREKILGMISSVLETSLKKDGVTGEKGLTGYTTIGPHAIAELLAKFDHLDSSLLPELLAKFPALHQTFRFHIDTWCFEKYYPKEGDGSAFASQSPNYAGVSFAKPAAGIEPSMFQFMWRLYELTRDPAFVQCLYIGNGRSVDGLPHDIGAPDPEAFQNQVRQVIGQVGDEIELSDVNKQQWNLAILRSGRGDQRRAAWLDYDAGGAHSHHDGMNIGLFAKGLDLLPDFGYPPVGYGGWDSPKAVWYTKTAAHNTVAVDGKDQPSAEGTTTLWGSGKQFHIIRANAPRLIQGERYERTLALIDVSSRDFYLVDLFHIVGGSDHAKFLSSTFGTVTTEKLNLQPAPDYGYSTLMRNFHSDPRAPAGWTAVWAVEDRMKYLPPETSVRLRYTDLTANAEASVAECWVDAGLFGGAPEWIPRLMIRRKTDSPPLRSCFVAVIDPFEQEPEIQAIQRWPLEIPGEKESPDFNGVLSLDLRDGRRHIIAFAGTPLPQDADAQAANLELQFHAEIAFVSERGDQAERVVLCNGSTLRYKGLELRLRDSAAFLELSLDGNTARIESCDKPPGIDTLRYITPSGKKTAIPIHHAQNEHDQ